jgi:hypothetical protein
MQYLPEAQRETFGAEMAEMLLARALKALHAALPKNEQSNFETIMNGDRLEARAQFLGTHQELFKKIIVEESVKLEKEINAGMAE